jgi:hypothetical protein
MLSENRWGPRVREASRDRRGGCGWPARREAERRQSAAANVGAHGLHVNAERVRGFLRREEIARDGLRGFRFGGTSIRRRELRDRRAPGCAGDAVRAPELSHEAGVFGGEGGEKVKDVEEIRSGARDRRGAIEDIDRSLGVDDFLLGPFRLRDPIDAEYSRSMAQGPIVAMPKREMARSDPSRR